MTDMLAARRPTADADASAILIPYHPREAISVSIAAARAGISADAMVNWCKKYGLGRKIGGHWQVSSPALWMHLEGGADALRLYLQGDRESALIYEWFRRANVHGILPSLSSQKNQKVPQTPHACIDIAAGREQADLEN